MAKRDPIKDARDLRRRQTEAESLLWSMLRSKQLCGQKFRRQHPEPPYVLDFACIEKRLCVELDGEYHEHRPIEDFAREDYLKSKGWNIARFTNEELLKDPESVGIAIARYMGLQYSFKKRRGGISSAMDRQMIKRKTNDERN